MATSSSPVIRRERMETEERAPLSRPMAIFLAGIAGITIGAVLFRNPAPDSGITGQPQERPATPTAPVPRPHLVVETQIARQPEDALGSEGAHRFANAGGGVLKLERGWISDGLFVREFPREIAPYSSGYVTVGWSPVPTDARRQWQGFVQMQTNDVDLKVFHFVIVEDTGEVASENPGQ